ncbi:class II glutamine amidotransferase [Synechocystis sp. PCC 6714]|uniref:class II glutamine amidotransferase n=2 Tax=unclassified Synechocystis TaxID=2640012 RepID=UPI0004911833|nr:class II glutamine amidotransferase [Synechocystis sp. PCC 6714]AIE75666.1 Glutamine amidotransferase, class-II [Synechocystis sp. PCC 6714]MCT0253853.1 class II glutamine amidotransferase [Synechocystis sp. CS-94]
MCQLLGMNCNVPTDICFSFEGFCARGGKTDEHRDGWGIAFFEDLGCRLFLDDNPSISSPIAELVKKYPIKSRNVIAHIRKATQGEVGLENCHPFQRELWGNYWVFAHNGNLENFEPNLIGPYQPVGATDSEKAFCLLLQILRENFPNSKPSLEKLRQVLQTIMDIFSSYGIFNCLLSNGEYLFVYCTTQLHYLVRQAPFAAAHLVDEDITVDFQALTSQEDRVAIIATIPLTDNESWTAIAPGKLLVFQDGIPILSET